MRHRCRRSSRRFAGLAAILFLALLACRSEGSAQQAPGHIPTSRAPVVTEAAPEAAAESGVALVCEVYCSETELRTALARLRWAQVPGQGPEAASPPLPQRLDATVFHDGFAKDLYVSLPLAPGQEPAAAVPSATVSRRGQAELRAFQIRLAEGEPLFSAQGTRPEEDENAVVVENLEPGMSYTWRLVFAGAAGGAAPTVTCQAPVCPADMVREGPR